ncbi:GHKL domain-containing protein [Bacteroidales bacterium OttesenSCG-928-E04]|nr:GHKL domain-containing protein [Bacteroidales bacterium OttesenSCG-928-E04]
MLNAIESNDFSFKFTEEFRYGNDEQVAKILNHIIGVLRQTHQNAIEKEKYYELILNSVNTGIVVLDKKGFVYQVNHEALKNLGMQVFTHISQLKRVNEQLFAVFEGAISGENCSVTFNNEKGAVTFSVRISETIIKEEALRIFVLHNINNELDDKEIESWMKITRILTHEIMNGITPITSISSTLLSQEQSPAEMKSAIETIHNTTKGLTSFVESYRKYTSVPAPNPLLFYLSPFLNELIIMISQEDPLIETRLDVSTEDLLLFADENLIRQVITNLLRNAVQAVRTCENPRISISAYNNANEEVVIEVADNGIGINDEISSDIFTPFFTTKTDGSGIGLAISRQIMRLSGGTLSLRPSTGEGETVFVLTFK